MASIRSVGLRKGTLKQGRCGERKRENRNRKKQILRDRPFKVSAEDKVRHHLTLHLHSRTGPWKTLPLSARRAADPPPPPLSHWNPYKPLVNWSTLKSPQSRCRGMSRDMVFRGIPNPSLLLYLLTGPSGVPTPPYSGPISTDRES
jgi:hypothetical protein